jgi:hypothetical protein
LVDAPGAATPRFPDTAVAVQRASELIEAELQALRSDEEALLVLASGAPGADILALEACARLGIETRLCLPMDVQPLMTTVFTRHPAWGERLQVLVKAHGPERTLVLQREAEQPTWMRLQRPPDPWERSNRWMLNLVQCWGAQRLTLLALWDGQEQNPSTGGTASMVRLARQTAGMATKVIDSGQLQRF